jgi:hypothetical protein
MGTEAALRVFRLFLSSRGDAVIGRQSAQSVVERLNGVRGAGAVHNRALGGWEAEHYRAHATFQAQIPPATDCEFVVGILRWWLDVLLPEDFPNKLEGRPFQPARPMKS